MWIPRSCKHRAIKLQTARMVEEHNLIMIFKRISLFELVVTVRLVEL